MNKLISFILVVFTKGVNLLIISIININKNRFNHEKVDTKFP